MVQEGFGKGGPRAAQELFLRWVATGEVFRAMDVDLRDRILDNGEVFFGLEVERFLSYAPDAGRIRRSGVPIVVGGGIESEGTFMVEGGDWLGSEFGYEVSWLPGGHTPYLHPGQSRTFAEALRPILKTLAA